MVSPPCPQSHFTTHSGICTLIPAYPGPQLPFNCCPLGRIHLPLRVLSVCFAGLCLGLRLSNERNEHAVRAVQCAVPTVWCMLFMNAPFFHLVIHIGHVPYFC